MRLLHDSEHNALRLTLDDLPDVAGVDRLRGLVDVAAGGRLVGIELRTGEAESDLRQRLRRWLVDPVAGEYVTVDPDGTVYIELTTGDPDDDVRSTDVDLNVELDASGELLSIAIPRRGAGYEISYPSGNR